MHLLSPYCFGSVVGIQHEALRLSIEEDGGCFSQGPGAQRLLDELSISSLIGQGQVFPDRSNTGCIVPSGKTIGYRGRTTNRLTYSLINLFYQQARMSAATMIGGIGESENICGNTN